MSAEIGDSILIGIWTYRSFINDPDLATPFNNLEFGRGNIRVDSGPMDEFKGLIYGEGWSLQRLFLFFSRHHE
jgi:hypothetical protein